MLFRYTRLANSCEISIYQVFLALEVLQTIFNRYVRSGDRGGLQATEMIFMQQGWRKTQFCAKNTGSHRGITSGILRSGGWPSGQRGWLPDLLSSKTPGWILR
jgi:hypothetical protein